MIAPLGYLQESCRCSAITHFHCESFRLSPLAAASTSGFVLLSRDVEFAREFYCTYVIEAPVDMRILIRVNRIHLPMLGASCRASVLRLYDGNTTQLANRQLIGIIHRSFIQSYRRTLLTKWAIISKIKHAIKLKTSPARLAQLLQPSLAFCFSLF